MHVYDALESRRSIRAFTGEPVPPDTLERILSAARHAPSGSNIQPWKVYVLTGAAKRRLSEAAIAFRRANRGVDCPQYQYYPTKWREPYQSRRRALGWALYSLLGIQRGQKDKMALQHDRNFLFFDAPVGMIFTIDADLELGSWLDYGMFVQSIMLAARAEGLHTCAQGAWVYHHDVVRQALPIPDTEKIVCGMALGHADEAAPENALHPDRVKPEEFVVYLDPK
jgi:nitroreductase